MRDWSSSCVGWAQRALCAVCCLLLLLMMLAEAGAQQQLRR